MARGSGSRTPASAPDRELPVRRHLPFSWTAPATDVGPVTFYVAANAANNNGNNQGDQIYNTKVTLTPAAVPTPTISSNGVVNGANFKPGISPGSWISILGSGPLDQLPHLGRE